MSGLRQLERMLLATAICFAVGAFVGTVALWGAARPFSGDGSSRVC